MTQQLQQHHVSPRALSSLAEAGPGAAISRCISHPTRPRTTLTEKLLLYGGLFQQAGA